ncbi:MAG: hypothetical protein OXR62_06230 [Ahrensia sp.]|nr:hypothetical protein [Ahrensia sp.]
MSQSLQFLENSLIVAAHPDDELLWFASILKQVDRVLLVFEDYWPDPAIGPARARALDDFPRDNVSSLRLPESATYGCADWANPQLTEFGIGLGAQVAKRDLKQNVLRLAGKSRAPKTGIRARYEENFASIVAALRPQLNASMNVFTHNPWGEYGHEEHIQLFRALDHLRGEIGFTLWMSNYCTERSMPLAMRYFDNAQHEFIQLPVDKDFGEQVVKCYRDAGCWTWSDDWVWFDTECFMQAPREPAAASCQGHLFPLNFFQIGF